VDDRDRAVVRELQVILSIPQSGEMDAVTISHIRGIQRIFGLRVTGFIDEHTMQRVRELRWVDRSAV